MTSPPHPEIKYSPGTTVQAITNLESMDTTTAMVCGVRFNSVEGWVEYKITFGAADSPWWIPEYLIQDELDEGASDEEIHEAIDESEVTGVNIPISRLGGVRAELAAVAHVLRCAKLAREKNDPAWPMPTAEQFAASKTTVDRIIDKDLPCND